LLVPSVVLFSSLRPTSVLLLPSLLRPYTDPSKLQHTRTHLHILLHTHLYTSYKHKLHNLPFPCPPPLPPLIPSSCISLLLSYSPQHSFRPPPLYPLHNLSPSGCETGSFRFAHFASLRSLRSTSPSLAVVASACKQKLLLLAYSQSYLLVRFAHSPGRTAPVSLCFQRSASLRSLCFARFASLRSFASLTSLRFVRSAHSLRSASLAAQSSLRCASRLPTPPHPYLPLPAPLPSALPAACSVMASISLYNRFRRVFWLQAGKTITPTCDRLPDAR